MRSKKDAHLEFEHKAVNEKHHRPPRPPSPAIPCAGPRQPRYPFFFVLVLQAVFEDFDLLSLLAQQPLQLPNLGTRRPHLRCWHQLFARLPAPPRPAPPLPPP